MQSDLRRPHRLAPSFSMDMHLCTRSTPCPLSYLLLCVSVFNEHALAHTQHAVPIVLLVAVSAEYAHSCAVTSTNQARCFPSDVANLRRHCECSVFDRRRRRSDELSAQYFIRFLEIKKQKQQKQTKTTKQISSLLCLVFTVCRRRRRRRYGCLAYMSPSIFVPQKTLKKQK